MTDYYLQANKVLLIVSYNLSSIEAEGAEKLKAVSQKAMDNGYEVIGLSASGTEDKDAIKKKYSLGFDFYICDEKALKTVIRSNPGFLIMNKGTIMQKKHWNDAKDLDFN